LSGETETNVSGWSVDTLKAHFDELRRTDQETVNRRFIGAEQAVNRALDAADKANTKSDAAIEKRFDGVNEFRKTLADQTQTFMPRAEVEAIVKAQNDKIDDLRGTRRTGVASVGALVVGAAVVLAVIVQIIVFTVNHV
jgi:hypothetical protein